MYSRLGRVAKNVIGLILWGCKGSPRDVGCKLLFLKRKREIRGLVELGASSVCLTLSDPMGCNPPGSSVHGIFQARILERLAISSSRGSSPPRDGT